MASPALIAVFGDWSTGSCERRPDPRPPSSALSRGRHLTSADLKVPVHDVQPDVAVARVVEGLRYGRKYLEAE